MRQSILFKKCGSCKLVKSTSEFYRRAVSSNGLMSICKNCAKIKAKLWFGKNRQKETERRQYWHANNLARDRATKRRVEATRRAKKAGVLCNLTKAEWSRRLIEFNHSCAYCLNTLISLIQEHMLPISKGGTHTIDNVIPVCRTCNSSKNNKTLLKFARQITVV